MNIIEALADFRKWRSKADGGGDDSSASANYTRDTRTAAVDENEGATTKTPCSGDETIRYSFVYSHRMWLDGAGGSNGRYIAEVSGAVKQRVRDFVDVVVKASGTLHTVYWTVVGARRS